MRWAWAALLFEECLKIPLETGLTDFGFGNNGVARETHVAPKRTDKQLMFWVKTLYCFRVANSFHDLSI